MSAFATLNNINRISVDKDVPLVHHYIFVHNNRRYTYNQDYIEHRDESITGYVLGLDRNNYIISYEKFKIEPDGNIIQKGIFRNYAINKKIIKG
jgi:hypothetical protein